MINLLEALDETRFQANGTGVLLGVGIAAMLAPAQAIGLGALVVGIQYARTRLAERRRTTEASQGTDWSASDGAPQLTKADQAVSALRNMGWKKQTANAAVSQASSKVGDGDLEALIRASLAEMQPAAVVEN